MLALVLLFCPPVDVVTLEPETGPRVTFKECYSAIRPAKRPDGVTKAPDGGTTWFVFPWGEGEAVVAAGLNAVWPDRDGDGDLTEEEAVPCKFSYGEPVEFTMKLKMPSRTIEARLQARFASASEMRLTNLTRMSGKVQVGGKEMAVSLTDYMVNGRYDDVYTTKTAEYWLCDHAHFDVNRDGKFRDRIPPMGEDFSLARGYVLEDAAHDFEVLDRGERIRFVKLEKPLVSVKVNVPEFSIALVSDEFGSCHLDGKDGTAKLPAGRYRLDYYDYTWKGAQVDGYWHKEDGVPFLEIKEGVEFALTGKLRYTLEHEPNPEGGLLAWTICFGPNGERVELTPEGADGNIEPIVSIETPEGKELFSVSSHWC
ncbi:MAG: hypothetical protein FD180_3802 [Planctomycetota bacterium]|nr:MAG: hypothetical protein FD180_3802 [Planctomycetota bacterium]